MTMVIDKFVLELRKSGGKVIKAYLHGDEVTVL